MEQIIRTINNIKQLKKDDNTNINESYLYLENINNYDIIRLLLHNKIYHNNLIFMRYPINYCNNIDIYKLLYLNDKPDYLNTALIYSNNIDILHFLLEKGAIIDNSYFMKTENIELIEYIFKNKLKHEIDDDILYHEESITKLELYIKYNNINKNIINENTINIFGYNSLKILLDNNMNIQDDILFYVDKYYNINKFYEIIKLFLNKGININYIKDDYNLLLNIINIDNDQYYDIILFLINKGININYKDKQNRTILFHYCLNNTINYKIVDLFISYGLDIQHLDKYNRNILFYQHNNDNIDNFILKYKVNINIKDIYGNTILHDKMETLYCFSIEYTYMKIFLKYLNINELNNNNETILHLLCKHYSYYTLKEFTKISVLFINKYNANTYQENNDGLIPYDILLKSNVELDDTMKILYTEIKSNTKSSNKI